MINLLFIFSALLATIHSGSALDRPAGGEAVPGPETGDTVIYHDYPTICQRSDQYRVKINGRSTFVYYATVASFVSFESNDTVDVEISVAGRFRNIRILPLHLGITPEINGQTISFRLPSAKKVYVETDLEEQLFIYGNAIETDKPDPEAPGVTYFKAGQVYEVGELNLNPGETVYVEGGAVFRGSIRGTRANNAVIRGPGVMDGSYYSQQRRRRVRNLLIEDSRDVTIRDLIMVEPQSWTITMYHCENIVVDNVKEISHMGGTDGVDIVSSHGIRVVNSILRNDDDCIAVKAFTNKYMTYSDITQNTHLKGVADVLVTGCAIQTNEGGQVFEIGHELMEEPITNIRYVDCDVLGAHDFGGVFGIHNADGATISNILYENIRVDHYYNKLIDLRIVKSRFSGEEKIGRVEHIVFRDISVTASRFNEGYSISLIGGYDEDHKIMDVKFENFRINGVKVTNADQLDLYMKQAENVTFQ